MGKKASLRFLSFLALFSLFAAVSFLFVDFFRENLVFPLYSFVFYIMIVLKNIPLWVYCAFLVTLTLLLAGNTLIDMRSWKGSERAPKNEDGALSRYDYWKELLSEGAENEYAKEKLFIEARRLLLLAFSGREGACQYSKKELRALAADVPPEIRRLLENTHVFSSVDSRKGKRWKRLLGFSEVRHESALLLERNIEEILRCIEDILEVARDDDTCE